MACYYEPEMRREIITHFKRCGVRVCARINIFLIFWSGAVLSVEMVYLKWGKNYIHLSLQWNQLGQKIYLRRWRVNSHTMSGAHENRSHCTRFQPYSVIIQEMFFNLRVLVHRFRWLFRLSDNLNVARSPRFTSRTSMQGDEYFSVLGNVLENNKVHSLQSIQGCTGPV